MTETNGPVLVAGAGIGGLTAARALDRHGIPVRILERGDRIRALGGSALTIWTNALAALERIGLADEVAARGVPLEWQEMRARSGELINRVPVGEIGRRAGRCGIGIRRQELLRALFDSCRTVPISYHAKVVGLHQDKNGVTVTLDNGRTVRGRALIGADGVRSRVRAALLSDGPPEPDGHRIWRGISEGRHGFPAATTYMVLGPDGARCVAWPVADGAVCWSVSRNGPPGPGTDGTPRQVRAALLRLLDGFPEPVRAIVAHTPAERILRTDLFSRRHTRTWAVSRTALLGDAAHAMPTVYGQGACLAIEDAVVLADALAAAPDPERGLKDYQERRLPRVEWIRQRVFQLSHYQGWELPTLVAMRNAVLRRLPASATEAVWDRLLTFDDGLLPATLA